jgi:hypothetical protein
MKELFSTGFGILGTSFDIDGFPGEKMVQYLSYKAASHISLPFFQRFVDRFGKRPLGSAQTSLWGLRIEWCCWTRFD